LAIQVLTIDEFLSLPKVAIKRADRLSQIFNQISNRAVLEEEVKIIEEEITQLSALMILMLDHNIKTPNLKKYKISDYEFGHTLKIRTYYEVFNLLVNEDFPFLYSEFKD
jgi:hypothetical protein